MRRERVILIGLLLLAVCGLHAQQEGDSLAAHRLQEVFVSATPKENADARQRPSSATSLNRAQLQSRGVESLRSIGSLAPNFFMPDYGSRQTSAIYIRGIGSRIGTPAVGLMVDGIPYYDKSAFDFSLVHADAVEVARGPQNTLYGRNTMGGLVKVSTLSPFRYQGTDVHLGYATGNHQRRVSLTHYQHATPRFAFSAGAFYDGNSGFFTNSMTGSRVDKSNAAGLRLRGIYKATDRLSFDANLHYEYSGEGAYPYYYTGVTKGTETHPDYIGKISTNLDGSYRRHLVNAGVHTEYKTAVGELHAVTAYQHINDCMFMDQDFLWDDTYSLMQRQRIHILSQELVWKCKGKDRYDGLFGANFFYQWQNVNAPVTFRKDGVAMLNGIINAQASAHMPVVHSGPMTMAFQFNDAIQGDQILFDDDFSTPTMGVALFHQSEAKDIFGAKGLSLTMGVRLDYEKMWLRYGAWYDFQHTYSLNGHLTMPTMEKDITMVPDTTFDVKNHSFNGRLSNDYIKLLPKLALQYKFANGNVYASISRGFRSGGYNVQNISELLRGRMQTDMMQQVRDATLPVLNAQPMVPDATKQQVADILNGMAQQHPVDVGASCGYSPEYAWNYEVGTHLDCYDRRIQFDASAFYSDVRDLQLSQMSQTGLGRIITNAGRSRSFGVEATLQARPVDHLLIIGTYGYTHATFVDYHTVASDGSAIDYAGNYVPYMPRHTFDVDASYAFPLRHRVWHTLKVGTNVSGAGQIYWDEANAHQQDLYGLLGVRLGLSSQRMDIQLWGRNLTDTRYNTFWFNSADRGFEQHGRPLQVGVDVRVKL